MYNEDDRHESDADSLYDYERTWPPEDPTDAEPLYVIDDNDEYASEMIVEEPENRDLSESGFSGQVNGRSKISDSRETKEIGEKGAISKPAKKTGVIACIKMMVEILLNPANGWRMLLRSGVSDEQYFFRAVAPLSLVAGLSEFAAVFYGMEGSIFTAMTTAVSVVVALIAGYFSVIALGGIFLPKATRQILRDKAGKLYTGVGISSLALFYTLYNCIPMLQPILVFLPLWTIYALFRGIKIFRFANVNEIAVIGAMSVMTISFPACWLWVLTEYIF